jgi:hypothetical protein
MYPDAEDFVIYEDHICLYWWIFLKFFIAIGTYIIAGVKVVYVQFTFREYNQRLGYFAQYDASKELLAIKIFEL